MKIKLLFAIVLTLASFIAGAAQTLDKAELDQFFDRLAEKNKAMGSLTIAKDGKVVYSRAIGHYISALESEHRGHPMRAEPQKLVDSIKEALVLLRRHL